MKIIPISEIKIDWNKYLLACKEVLGRSVTTPLDQAGMPVGSLASFISTLSVFQNEDANIDLCHAGSLLKHISLGFFLIAEKQFQLELIQESNLKIATNEGCAIVTGTLEEWKSSIINGTTENARRDVRLFYDSIILYFESIGLGGIFSQSYQKVRLKDQTFKLLPK